MRKEFLVILKVCLSFYLKLWFMWIVTKHNLADLVECERGGYNGYFEHYTKYVD